MSMSRNISLGLLSSARYRDVRARLRAAAEAEHPRHHGRRHRLLEHQRLQPRHDGLSHAQHRPHRQRRRDPHRLLRPAILHRRPRRLHHRPKPDAHGPPESWAAGSEGRTVGEGPDARRAAQAAGLHDRTIRQEPSRRPQRVSADGSRLRRVFRQSLPLECGGRARAPGLSEEYGVQAALRSARRPALHGDHRRDTGRGSAFRQVGQAELHRHRPTHQETHGDGGRGVSPGYARLHRPCE